LKILVIGSGGREHALAWKLAQSPGIQKIFVAPGNGGTATEHECVNFPVNSVDLWVALVERENVGLVVVGPEAPLAAGVVDALRAKGRAVFGPTQAAAQLESSKAFAKAFMVRHEIPTAHYGAFEERAAAHAHIEKQGAPIVVKADGLAAGKGVVVAMNADEAHAAVDQFLVNAGDRVVIEEFLEGEEASFIVMVDGRNVLPLATSQDHKRLRDGDQGPNTGGMGAYSPAPVVTPTLHARIMREIILPTVQGMAAEGHPYTGFLYAGVMIDKTGAPKVLEFNCRLGDPEAQPILMRLKSDLVKLIQLALEGKLDTVEAQWDRRTALAVVMAAAHYPDTPRAGDLITLPTLQKSDGEEDVKIFHAGTKLENDKLVTSGGRVLAITALGDSPRQAQTKAYATLERVSFSGAQYRTDIGHRALIKRS
jgi:phosphoribosylamine---glycine ligase